MKTAVPSVLSNWYGYTVNGTVHAFEFLHFWGEAESIVGPLETHVLDHGDILIMDNASFHHNFPGYILDKYLDEVGVDIVHLPTYCQGWIDYEGTHVPMSVPGIGLIKRGPNYGLFQWKLHFGLFCIFLESSSALSLAACFFRIFGLLSLSVGFFSRPGRTYMATLLCFSWLFRRSNIFLAFFTKFGRHTLQGWVSRNLELDLLLIVLSKSGLFWKRASAAFFVQRLVYF